MKICQTQGAAQGRAIKWRWLTRRLGSDGYTVIRLAQARLFSIGNSGRRGSRMSTRASLDWSEKGTDEVARWQLGDNAAVGTARLLLLVLVYIVGSVLILNWLLR